MSQPLECRLEQQAAGAQLREWQALLSESAAGRQRPSPTELLIHLGHARLEEVVDLARREKACCPFFDFALRIGSDDLVLSVSVPAGASAILDGFASATA